ncbi:MAG: hypothetical protein AB7T06_34790 [Kofleriaceae bacterium]
MNMEMPFLVRHGQVVWVVLVVIAVIVTILVMVAVTNRRRRAQSDPDAYMRSRIAWTIASAILSGVAMTILLYTVGAIAMKMAGDNAFDERESDVISATHPIALASATPGHRDDALYEIERAGFELRQTCTTRLANGRIKELLEHVGECKNPATWTAYAHFVEGRPCEAADALAGALNESPTDFQLLLGFVTRASCRRWAEAAVIAERLATANSEDRARWSCLAALAHKKANRGYVVPSNGCFVARLEGATEEEKLALASSWAKDHADVFDLGVRPTTLVNDRTSNVAEMLAAMAAAPAAFSSVATLERIEGHDIHDLMDPLGSISSGLGLGNPADITPWAATILERDAKNLRVVPRADLLMSASVGDVIVGDFDKARARLAERRVVLSQATADDDGPRRGTLSAATGDTERMETIIRYRLGEPIDDRLDTALTDLQKALFVVRTGKLPARGELVTEAGAAFIERTFAGDFSPLRREIFSKRTRRLQTEAAFGRFIFAFAPRLKPAPPELIASVETPHWSLRIWSPGTLAWDAAGRRDTLRLLGENDRAARWAEIARRQWAIVSAPDLAVVFALLDDVIL